MQKRIELQWRHTDMFWSTILVIGCLAVSGVRAGCEEDVMQCATSQEVAIVNSRLEFDFETTCELYGDVYDCLSNLEAAGTGCTSYNYPEAFADAKGLVYDYSDHLCGTDGSLQGCAYDVTVCLAATDDITSTDPDLACGAYAEFSDCAELIKDQMLCAADTESALMDLVETYRADLFLVCFATCDTALDVCRSEAPVTIPDVEDRLTEEEQEVLCAKIEAATNCLSNGGELEALCQKEGKVESFQQELDTQTQNYEEFCSIDAKTCTADLELCAAPVTKFLESVLFGSLEDYQEVCSVLTTAIECIDGITSIGYCQGDLGSQQLALAMDEQTRLYGTYCGANQCIAQFFDCYKLVGDVTNQIVDEDTSPTCQKLNEASECASAMSTFVACYEVQFEDMAFEDATTNINELLPLVCEEECQSSVPSCYGDVLQNSAAIDSCDDAEVKQDCATETMSVAPSWCEEQIARSTTVQEESALYLEEECSTSSAVNSSPAAHISVSLLLLCAAFVTSFRIGGIKK